MKNYYGNFESKVDSKNRFILPARLGFKANDKIIYSKSNSSYRIYLIERLNEIVKDLKERKYIASSEKEYERIANLLQDIFDSLENEINVDKQKRIILPHEMKDSVVDNTVYLQGRYDYVDLSVTRQRKK